jgi:hypothetical protein
LSSAAAAMAELIIAELHGRLLRGIAAETSVHFQGLRAAAGHLRRAGLLDSRLAKKLAAVDAAFAISRHITVVSAEQCVSEVLLAIAHGVKAAAERKVSLEGTAEEEVTKKDTDLDQVEVDKLAEAEAATKEKNDLEQAATEKAAEEMAAAQEKSYLERVAKEKVAVEKIAEQKAADEEAAKEKTRLEQVAKEKAAAEKVSAELKDDEEKAYVAQVLAEMDAADKAIEEKAAAKEKAYLGQVGAKENAAKKKAAVGKTTTGEKAAKKAKGDNFADVDMDIEALTQRIDSMPGSGWGWEQESWRRSGWR